MTLTFEELEALRKFADRQVDRALPMSERIAFATRVCILIEGTEQLQRERDEAVKALREAGADICWASCGSYTPRHSESHTKIINALSRIEGGQDDQG